MIHKCQFEFLAPLSLSCFRILMLKLPQRIGTLPTLHNPLVLALRCCVINIHFLTLRHRCALLWRTEYTSRIIIILSVSGCALRRDGPHSFAMHDGISLHLQFVYHRASLIVTTKIGSVIVCYKNYLSKVVLMFSGHTCWKLPSCWWSSNTK